MSSLIDVKEIKFYKNSTVFRLNRKQALTLAIAIIKSLKHLKTHFDGVEFMTVPKITTTKIVVSVFNTKEAKKK